MTDVIHRPDFPGVDPVCERQPLGDISRRDRGRGALAAGEGVDDFVIFHTEDVRRGRPAQCRHILVHRNSRRCDAGRIIDIVNIVDHVFPDEVEHVPGVPVAGSVAHGIHGLNAPVDLLAVRIGHTTGAVSVGSVEPQRGVAGHELIETISGEFIVVTDLNQILNSAGIVRVSAVKREVDVDACDGFHNCGVRARGVRRSSEAGSPSR